MIEIISKIENNSFCPNCHAKLPKELTHINEIGEIIIFCPYCGTQIILKKNKDESEVDRKLLEISAETKEKEDMKFSLTEKEIRQIIRIFIYRNIYQLIKQKKSIMKRLTWQKDISTAQIAHISFKVRRILLKASNPVEGTTDELNGPTLRKIENYLKRLKTLIKKKKNFRKKYAHLLAENIEFTYNLIRADYEFQGLSEAKRKIVLDLKDFFGFKEENLSKKSAIYNISLFLALKIYAIIRQNKNIRLEKSVIDDITNVITQFVIDKNFCKELIHTLETCQKGKLSGFLRQFQFDITYDWVYRTSFQDHLFKLIYLVNQLFLEKDHWLNLTGAEKIIAEGLQESTLFQDDNEFSAYLRLNFTLILCRIIHKIMQDSPEIPQTISKHSNLNPSIKQEILEYILNEIIAQKKINFEFLEKFYKLTLEEFQTNYEKFQAKLATDMIYYYSFRDYLGKLIKIVFDITHSIRKKSKLSKLERVIIKDLANYNFRWHPRKIKHYYFYSNEKKAEITDNSEELSESLSLIDSESVDFNSGTLENQIDMKNRENNIHSIPQLPNKGDITHYNQWFTDKIQSYMKNLDIRIKFLFKPYIPFSKMSSLFGLSKNYLRESRNTRNAKNIIAKSKLDKMRLNFQQKIQNMIKQYPHFFKLLKKFQSDILSFIDNYENVLDPLPVPHYQMYHHHPNFKRDYFSEINTPEQAYWLGFLFADGCISLEHKSSGDYFRMGVATAEKDEVILINFCKSIGLNINHIKKEKVSCSYTEKKTFIVRIRWGDQQMAQGIIKLGMEYEFDDDKGKRVKNSKLPFLKTKNLMLAFLLGFYDGDGSLGRTKSRGKVRIFPTIISSNKDFLLEIKKYFNIKYEIYPHSYEKYDYKNDKIVKTECYRLYLGKNLLREMLSSYKNSLERKRVPLKLLEDYNSPQRIWLKKVLQKEKLIQISNFLSPFAIGKILGVDGRTIITFADEEVSINLFKPHGHYTTIRNSIRWNGETSQYYEDVHFWENYLKRLGKFEE